MGAAVVVLEGGIVATARWEASIERKLAAFMRDLIETSPPPGESSAAEDLLMWAELLDDDAALRLAQVGAA